jgi:hypothetical protein
MISIRRVFVLSLVVTFGALLLFGHAEGYNKYKKVYDATVSGVTLRAHLWLDTDTSHYYGTGLTEASQSMEGLWVKNRGQESCNFAQETDWQVERWTYGTSTATIWASGGFRVPICYTHTVWTDGWYKWRNWTWSPPISRDTGPHRLLVALSQ